MTARVLFLCFSQDVVPRHEAMLQTFLNQGSSVTVVTWNRGECKQDEIPGVRYIRIEWRPIVARRTLILDLPEYYRCVLGSLGKDDAYDLCVLTHMMMLPLRRRITANRFLYDISEYLNFDLADYFGFFRRSARIFLEAFEKFWMRRVDGVTYVGSKDDWLADYVSVSKKSLEINNFPDLNRLPDAGLAAAVKNRYRGKKVVTYVGGLSIDRGVDLLLRSAASVCGVTPDAHFVLMGRARQETPYLEALITELGLENHVTLLDHMSFDQMLSYLSVSKVGIALYKVSSSRSASRAFGFYNSRKILTYMQMGVPVLVSAGNPFGKFVESEGCGKAVEIENVESVVNAIIELLTRPNLYGQAGKTAIKEKYNWQNEERKLTEFLCRL